MSTIINMTPHSVNLISEDCVEFNPKTRSYSLLGEPNIITTFEPCGEVPRAAQKETKVSEVNGIQIFQIQYGEVENLPEQQNDVYLIVSALTANAAKSRDDLIIPTHMVRNETGNIVGCLAFSKV